MKEKGKTIGLFVEPKDYEHYVSLGLRQRKEALAAAKTALLSVIGKSGLAGNAGNSSGHISQAHRAASDIDRKAAINSPVQQGNIDNLEGPATNIDAKGFLDGGW